MTKPTKNGAKPGKTMDSPSKAKPTKAKPKPSQGGDKPTKAKVKHEKTITRPKKTVAKPPNTSLNIPMFDETHYDLSKCSRVHYPIRSHNGFHARLGDLVFDIHATGSQGNFVGISNGQDSIHIDMGKPYCSWTRVEPHEQDIKNILFTHSHGDHIGVSTVTKLLKRNPWINMYVQKHDYNVEIAGKSLRETTKDLPNNVEFITHDDTIHLDSMTIHVIKGVHSVPVVGFVIHDLVSDKIIMYATDTCTFKYFKGYFYDVMLVEANFSESKLSSIESDTQRKLASDSFYDKYGNKGIRALNGVMRRLVGSRQHISVEDSMIFYMNQRKSKETVLIHLHRSDTYYE